MGKNEMTMQQRLDFLKKQREKKQTQVITNRKQGALNKSLSLGPDESIAEKFPEEHEKLRAEILSRLPANDPNSGKFANAMARHLMGDPVAKVEAQMGVNYGKIHQVMRMIFPKREEMQEVLENSLRGCALIANAVFMQKAHELTPRDAAMSAGIFAQRSLEAKRDREGKDIAPVDFHLVVKLEATMADLNRIKQVPGKVIETIQDKPK